MWQIIGQPKAVSILQRSLETNSLAHAYIFTGPSHVGKSTLALNLAQALNCSADEPPCGRCDSCKKIASVKHADVQVIGIGVNDDSTEARPRAEISIEQIRQVQHSASLPPFEGNYKIYIINEAEFLSIEASNCLLKTLEEPADRVVFILLTTNEHLLPATVVSRCQLIELSPMAPGAVEAALIKNWDIDPEKAKLLARLSHGCLGWAVSAAFQESLIRERSEQLDGLCDVINVDIEERFAYANQLAARFSQNRTLVFERLNLWLDWWRDLLLVKAGSADNITNIDRIDTLSRIAREYSLVQIRAFIHSIQMAGKQLRQNANPQLVLEVLMLDIPVKLAGGSPVNQFEVSYG